MLGLTVLHVALHTTGVVVSCTGCTRHLIHRHHVDLWIYESSWLMTHETSGLLDVLDVWLPPRVRVLEAR